VTGHADESSSDLKWPTLAAAAAQGLTVVVYMGLRRVASIRQGLLAALGADTPAALVQHASTAQERRLVTTLGLIVEDAAAADVASPAILNVGDVLRAVAAQSAERVPISAAFGRVRRQSA